METNKITLAGEIYGLAFSHTTMGEDFYEARISVGRQSGTVDDLRLIIPSIIAKKIEDDKEYGFIGSVRTRNVISEDCRKLDVFVFVNEVFDYPGYDINEVQISIGYICKAADVRKTPKGRQIIDFLLATNRPTGKSDYIPCIAWGRSAERLSDLKIGTKINLLGRLQSREYSKKISETEFEERIAYELSTFSFEVSEEYDGSKFEEDR